LKPQGREERADMAVCFAHRLSEAPHESDLKVCFSMLYCNCSAQGKKC
jgi:hypothetical protein